MTDDPTDLTTLGGIQGVMQRPKELEQSHAGSDNIRADEIPCHRLAIAQGLSPQITPGDLLHIKGLELFDMFNDLTAENYGKGPLTFVPLRRDVRHIEFIPRSEGGGIVDLDVPFGDPRLEWGPRNPSDREENATDRHDLCGVRGAAPPVWQGA